MVGGHRFYLKRIASAVTMLILFLVSLVLMVVIGAFGLIILGVWTLIDAVLIPRMVQGHNNRLIREMRM